MDIQGLDAHGLLAATQQAAAGAGGLTVNMLGLIAALVGMWYAKKHKGVQWPWLACGWLSGVMSAGGPLGAAGEQLVSSALSGLGALGNALV